MTLIQILLTVQDRLKAEVPELAYIDKDWGQLYFDHPAVKFPCALLDIDKVSYTQQGQGLQQADTAIVITVADMRLVPSSAAYPNREQAYKMIELLEKIHNVLQLFYEGDYSPLFRTEMTKVVADSSRECYKMVYQTAYGVGLDTAKQHAPGSSVKIQLKVGT